MTDFEEHFIKFINKCSLINKINIKNDDWSLSSSPNIILDFIEKYIDFQWN